LYFLSFGVSLMSSITSHLFEYDDEDPPEPEYFVADDDGDQIPPDPLLKSGTFILEPTTLTTELPQTTQNGVAADPVQLSVDREPPEQCTSPPGVSKSTAERVTSSAAAAGAESTPRKKGQPQVASGAFPERPSWLPEGWGAECKVRTSGASAGSFDKYYIEPVSGRKFRSKVEVEYFLQTGSKPNKKRSDADADADANGNRPEKSGSKKKKSAPLNFDFKNLPEKVRWVLTDAVKDQWTPFVGDKIIPKSTRQEWNAAFQFSCS
jgi:hypothetical protein